MSESNEPVKKTDLLDLEFPDWSGMDNSPRRIDSATAFHLSEQHPEWVTEAAIIKWRAQRTEKCEVEFGL